MTNSDDKKLWWMPFEVAAWLSDPALRQCSIESRGVWIDMLCVMWKNAPQGYFVGSDQPDFIPRLSRLTGVGVDRLVSLIEELRAGGVFSESAGGVIFSRRMVKEAETRAKRSVSGRVGGKSKRHRDEANSKQTRSKLEANSKQTRSKPPSTPLNMNMTLGSGVSCLPEGGPGETAADSPSVPMWDGVVPREAASRLVAAWNASPGTSATPVDTYALTSVYDALVVSDLAPPEARSDPVGWLQRRAEAYLSSSEATREGGRWKSRLGNWLRPRDGRPCRALEPDEHWNRATPTAAEAPVDILALAREGERRRAQMTGGGT